MTFIMFWSLLALAPLHPRPGIPPFGGEIDQTFEIVLQSMHDGPVVTIAARGARIVISRALLEELAAQDGPRWTNEEERQTQIAAGRAKKLLDQAGLVKPDLAMALPIASLGDAEHLLAQILESGKASVIPDGSGAPVDSITVRFLGNHPAPTVGFGRISFSLAPSAEEFFSVSWFAS